MSLRAVYFMALLVSLEAGKLSGSSAEKSCGQNAGNTFLGRASFRQSRLTPRTQNLLVIDLYSWKCVFPSHPIAQIGKLSPERFRTQGHVLVLEQGLRSGSLSSNPDSPHFVVIEKHVLQSGNPQLKTFRT